MQFSSDGKLLKRMRTIGLSAILVAGIFAFSPTVQNQIGGVQSPHERSRPIPDFTTKTLDGTAWSLNDYRGKVVLLNFWATWCPPCRIETPALVALHNRFAPQGFLVAGMAMDEDPLSDVPEFVRKFAIPYPILVQPQDTSQIKHIEVLPTSILIDRSGRIARIYQGLVTERGLTDDIEALLAERAEIK